MRLIMVVVVAALVLAGPTLVGGGSGATLLAQVETAPQVDPTAETNPATWASLIWIAVGLVFVILLVGAVLLGVRSTGDRPPMWRRRTRD